MTPRRLLAAFALLWIATACGELRVSPTDPNDDIDPSATYTRVRNEIFIPTCGTVGCHDELGQAEGLILNNADTYSLLVNRPSLQIPSFDRIEPSDDITSYLYLKITGDSRIQGDRMPQGRAPLSLEKQKLIRDWIRRGAPND